MKKYRSIMSIGDVFDDMAYGFNYFPLQRTNFTFRGQIVDTDNYEIRPRPEYADKLIRLKTEELEALERERESSENYFKVRKQKLEEEKEALLRVRDNKSG